MYDTLTIRIPGYPANIDIHELSGGFEGTNVETGECWRRGAIRNLQVRRKCDFLSVSGSLAKFYFGNNLMMHTRSSAARALNDVARIFEVPLSSMNVARIDIGVNVDLDFPIAEYLSRLGSSGRYVRDVFGSGETVRYRMSARAKTFYDKITEMRKRRAPIPEEWKNKNVLRFELRFLSKLRNQLRVAPITAATLVDETFYEHVRGRLYPEFENITMTPRSQSVFNPVSVPQLKDYLAHQGMVSLGGEPCIMSMINSARRHKRISAPQAMRMRSTVRDLTQMADCSNQDPILSELSSKILFAIQNAL